MPTQLTRTSRPPNELDDGLHGAPVVVGRDGGVARRRRVVGRLGREPGGLGRVPLQHADLGALGDERVEHGAADPGAGARRPARACRRASPSGSSGGTRPRGRAGSAAGGRTGRGSCQVRASSSSGSEQDRPAGGRRLEMRSRTPLRVAHPFHHDGRRTRWPARIGAPSRSQEHRQVLGAQHGLVHGDLAAGRGGRPSAVGAEQVRSARREQRLGSRVVAPAAEQQQRRLDAAGRRAVAGGTSGRW